MKTKTFLLVFLLINLILFSLSITAQTSVIETVSYDITDAKVLVNVELKQVQIGRAHV